MGPRRFVDGVASIEYYSYVGVRQCLFFEACISAPGAVTVFVVTLCSHCACVPNKNKAVRRSSQQTGEPRIILYIDMIYSSESSLSLSLSRTIGRAVRVFLPTRATLTKLAQPVAFHGPSWFCVEISPKVYVCRNAHCSGSSAQIHSRLVGIPPRRREAAKITIRAPNGRPTIKKIFPIVGLVTLTIDPLEPFWSIAGLPAPLKVGGLRRPTSREPIDSKGALSRRCGDQLSG
jgi:hypothetical protein